MSASQVAIVGGGVFEGVGAFGEEGIMTSLCVDHEFANRMLDGRLGNSLARRLRIPEPSVVPQRIVGREKDDDEEEADIADCHARRPLPDIPRLDTPSLQHGDWSSAAGACDAQRTDDEAKTDERELNHEEEVLAAKEVNWRKGSKSRHKCKGPKAKPSQTKPRKGQACAAFVGGGVVEEGESWGQLKWRFCRINFRQARQGRGRDGSD